jgi:hypothetical protein
LRFIVHCRSGDQTRQRLGYRQRPSVGKREEHVRQVACPIAPHSLGARHFWAPSSASTCLNKPSPTGGPQCRRCTFGAEPENSPWQPWFGPARDTRAYITLRMPKCLVEPRWNCPVPQ